MRTLGDKEVIVLNKAIEELDIPKVYNVYLHYIKNVGNLYELATFMKTYFEPISNIIDSDSSISKHELNTFWSASEKAFDRLNSTKRGYVQGYFKYLQRTGQWENAIETSSKWMVLEKDEYATSIMTEEVDRFMHYCMSGDYSNAFFILEKAFENCAYEMGDKEKFHIVPMRYKLARNMVTEVKRDLNVIDNWFKINKNNKHYISEYLKVLSVIKPKKALMGYNYLKTLKMSSNERVSFDLAIISESILSYLNTSLNPRIREELVQNLKVGYDVQRKMNARNKSVMFTEEIIFWRKIRKLVGEQ